MAISPAGMKGMKYNKNNCRIAKCRSAKTRAARYAGANKDRIKRRIKRRIKHHIKHLIKHPISGLKSKV